MKVSDLLAGALFVLLGLSQVAYGMNLPAMPGQRYGAGLFPIILGLGFALCGLNLAWTGWRERGRTGEALATLAAWVRDPFFAGNVAFVLVLIVLYVLLSNTIGFIPMSIAILTALFVRLKIPLRRSLVIALATTAAIQIGFANLLKVPLPSGILSRVLW